MDSFYTMLTQSIDFEQKNKGFSEDIIPYKNKNNALWEFVFSWIIANKYDLIPSHLRSSSKSSATPNNSRCTPHFKSMQFTTTKVKG
mgnify:CR=1 FL=1